MPKNKALITIFLIVFIDLMGFGLVIPLLPFIAEKFGAEPYVIGFLTATYSLFQLLAAPVMGRLSDRYGRKRLLIASQIGTFVGFILLAIAGNIWIVFLSRLIDGITGGNISIAQAYVADVTTKQERAKGMGVLGAAFGLGFIFGPTIAGVLSPYGLAVPAYFAAAASFTTIFTTFFFLKETVQEKEAIKSPKTKVNLQEFKKMLAIKPLGTLVIGFFLLNLSFSMLFGNFALWTQKEFNYGAKQNGFLFAYIGILAVVVQLGVLPYLVKKLKEIKLLLYSIIVMAIGFFLLPAIISPFFIYVALTFIAVGNGLSNPTIQALASEDVDPHEYGGVLGFFQSSGSFGRIFGPILGGVLFSAFGASTPFFVAAILITLIYFYLRPNLKPNLKLAPSKT
ncbi:hypothetical protein A2115_02790 [Candidatus Woesebacteria bacterium GWA1_41_8]|jgi:DHA1 family tetracycline resistance protein-like MFS transporter|uniref:Major facilitator superfamily (MFS) profile domain-containing protein n=1 Tax=Candidatus Woesebacteria bacterium GWA1_41_8 TaxID=1802471 RepID=A0A1F7WK76_9BACT|nr:MAG: hypothetical protein A2115_02790 [Candidatus Woesebacteria bacterium GWA1_41_8]